MFVTCFLVLLSTFAVILKYFCANLQQKCEYMYTSNRCLANLFLTILPVPVFICEDFLLPFCRPSTSQGDRSWHSDTAEGGLLSWPIMALRCSALHGSCDGFARMIPMMVLIPSSLSIQFPSIHVLEKPFDPSWFLGDVTGESLEMV